MDHVGSVVSLRLEDGLPDLTALDVARHWRVFGSRNKAALRSAARDYDLPVGRTKLLLAEQGLWIASDQVEELAALAVKTDTTLRVRVVKRAILHARRFLTSEYALRPGQRQTDLSLDHFGESGWEPSADDGDPIPASATKREWAAQVRSLATAESHRKFIEACLLDGCRTPAEVSALHNWHRSKGKVVATRLRKRWERQLKKAC